MADRYLLESGSPDGYLLEDGSGVLLLDTSVAWYANNSSADWTLSNSNLTANRGSTSAGFWAMLRANMPLTSGTFAVTVDAIGTGTFQCFVGFDTGAETQFPGQDGASNSVGYRNNGDIDVAGTAITTVATYTTGDIITCVKSGSTFTFKKNGATVYGPTDLTGVIGGGAPVYGAVYPAASNGNGTGLQLTLDPTGWGSTDVTVALTGQSLTGSLGTLLAATALALTGQSLSTAQGTVVGGQPVTGQSTSVAQGSTAPATSVALTGQSVSAARGTLVPGTAEALSGQSLAAAQGTPIPGTAASLTGQAATVSRGSVAPASSFALSGQSIVVAGGTLAPTNAVTISGQSLTVAQGTVSVGSSSNVTAALTGQSITTAQGSVTASTAIALLGQSAGLSQGAISAGLTLSVAGQTINVATGTLSPFTSPGLIGLSLSAASGNIVVFSSDVTASLTGQGIGLGLGTIIATAVNGSPQLQDIFVNGENLADEPLPTAGALNLITKPSGQIIDLPPYPPAELA